MKTVLILAAAGEGVTGLALLMVPSFVGTLLLGDEFSGVALPVARIAGIALIALAARPTPRLYVVVEMADDISKMRCGDLPAIGKFLIQEGLGDHIAARHPVPSRSIDGHGVE